MSVFSFPVATQGFADDCTYTISDAVIDARTGAPSVMLQASDGITVDSHGRLISFFPLAAPMFDLVHPTGVIASVNESAGTSLTYDAAGRVTKISAPLGQITTVTYGAGGRITRLDFGSGRFQAFGYNAAGKMTSFGDQGGDSATFAYDSSGRLTKVVAVITAVDPTDSYTYDSHGSVLSWSNKPGTVTNTLTYTHNASNDVTLVKNGASTDATLTYAGPHKLSQVANGGGTIAGFTYNSLSQLTEASNSSGPVTTFAYNAAGRLASTQEGTATTTYAYDALGRLVGFHQPNNTSVTITYLPGPDAITGNASLVKATSATLTGTVNPRKAPTSYHFEYGATTAYGHTTASATLPSGTSVVAIKAHISGLKPSTTYHYRLVASNRNAPAVGLDRKFATKVQRCHVPDLIGERLGQAKHALAHAHCRLGRVRRPHHVAHGTHLKVVSQHPAAGAVRPSGTRVGVKLAKP